ncbi:MAG TPA: mechanosensitive ion channel domain-containing protein, partial [Candidatus Saccharimonadales bacterium]|nr:mechanosensitive ion channel domain-containing protein [Candidatus Saccharimonadales bacterium]
MNTKAQVEEQLREQEDVKTALKQTAGTKETMPKPAPELRDKLWFGTYIFALLGLLAFYYVLGSDLIPAGIEYIPALRCLVLGAFVAVLTIAIAKSIRVYLINQIDSKPARYNLTRVLNLLTFLAIIIIVLTLLSANWYTALVSLGVLSLILGFALQTPITSLIGWVYLLIRQPYKVGDRIEIGNARGDVIDVSYLDTT